MVIKLILFGLLILIMIATIKNKQVYAGFIKLYHDDISLPFIAPYAFALIDKLNFSRRFPHLVNTIHQKMIILRGSKLSRDYTKIYLAKIITTVTILIFFSLAAVVADDMNYSNMVYGLLLTAIISFYLVKDLEKKVKQRKESIIIELPEFVNKIILLVNAGIQFKAQSKNVYYKIKKEFTIHRYILN
ncbi:hypothetical protein [Paracerasibacillus soli]|uniref:Uncharacterized protein n=1 Tax=Paracerasibacillus soli TaxID=480284 RepID=A0ABU5CSY8_9BACI|nr:hypothetical protein [Virgibacillus soli]MDY0408533.1 hypothetical protein [Virgibacillus soli]